MINCYYKGNPGKRYQLKPCTGRAIAQVRLLLTWGKPRQETFNPMPLCENCREDWENWERANPEYKIEFLPLEVSR